MTLSTPVQEIKTRKVEMVLQQLDTLPTLPAVAVRLLSLTGAADAKIQEVVDLLGADPSLTGKLLSLANSAMTGGTAGRGAITSVQQAVVRLGFEAVRNLVLSVKIFEAFQSREEPAEEGEAPAFERADFWKHSLAVATAAELLAARCKPKLNASDAFVCGLLHDVGKMAFDTAMPKSFARVVEAATLTRGDVADVERRIIGMDHALAGKRLAEAWNLPALITQVIWLHGSSPMPAVATPANGVTSVAAKGGVVNMPMVLVVGLADILARRQHIGFSGNYLFPHEPAGYMKHLGLTQADVDEVTAQLTDALEKRAQGIGLYDVASQQLYLESIANANAELGRLNQTLTTQNKKLAVRSACFELMTQFYQRIAPAASPAQLLREIGQVSHQFFDSPRMVLFSQDPDQHEERSGGHYGEVLLFDSGETTQEGFLMAMPPAAGDQRVNGPRSMAAGGAEALRNFTRPASPQLDWLTPKVSEFLGGGRCWFMPLLCGTNAVGGVVWVAKESNQMTGLADLVLVSQSLGMTLRTAQIREQQTVLTESLAASNRELGAVQQQLVRVKSLASVGEMAAGAAHEMNNPLAVVCGRAQLLAAKISDPVMKQEASLIAQQGERLSQIITDMMEFAKPQAPRPTPFLMETLVREAAASAMERAGSAGVGISVAVEPAVGVPECKGDVKQLRGAITEVVLNAIQASRAGGNPNEGAKVQVQLRFDPLDEQVIVQVADRGAGMTEEVMRQAFSPFFSSKTAGRNRGMGLAKALRWVENHGGTIRLDSAPGSGTTVVMILPAVLQ